MPCKTKCIGIVDYGTGNLKSVENAFIQLGAEARIIKSPDALSEVNCLVFPGQGTFDQCMIDLESSGFSNAIKEWISLGKPFFGICLGLQVLFEKSEEGEKKGLGVFPGIVKKFKSGSNLKVPHMGWNSVSWESNFSSPIMKGIENGDQFYFVHSFHVVVQDPSLSCLRTTYGYEFVSGVIHQNCVATQFHPEKSQAKGLQIYRNFIEKVVV